MKFFYILAAMSFIALVGTHQSATAHDGEDRCERCDDFRHGVGGKKPPAKDLVCVYYTRERSDGPVLLELTFGDGGTRRYRKESGGREGCFNIGRHWLKGPTVKLVICDTWNGAEYPPDDIKMVSEKPRLAREYVACLDGTEKCSTKGFKVKKP